MSTKSDRHDDARGSVLKKAVSFRNDLKFRITRKPSADISVLKSAKKKTSFSRSGSNNDSDRVSSTQKKNNDFIKELELETGKFSRGLQFMESVVGKGTSEQFHGAITIVLDQLAEFKIFIQKRFPNQESDQLRSEFGALHQNLAKLMGLSDPLLLSSEDTFINKQEATDLISSIRSNKRELVRLAIEHAENTKSQKSSSEKRNNVAVVIDNMNFEPDSSLTLGESSLLLQSINFKSKSVEILSNVCNDQDASVDEVDGTISVDVPPLPHSLCNVGKFNSMPKGFSLQHGAEKIPLSLSEKKRNSAGAYEVNATSNHVPNSFSQNVTVRSRHSPTSSIGSGVSASSEEILDGPLLEPSGIPNCGLDRCDSSSSQYDNMNDSQTDLADIASASQLIPLPLPAKKGYTRCPDGGISIGSPYDNVFTHMSSLGDVSAAFETGDGSEQLSPDLTSQVLSPMMPMMSLLSIASPNQTVRRHGPNVSEAHRKMLPDHIIKSSEVNCTEVSNSKNSRVPPPVPPKKKHVQAYLSALNGASPPSSFEDHSTCGRCPEIGENRGMESPQDLPCHVTSLQNSFPYIYANSDGIEVLSEIPDEDSELDLSLSAWQRDQSSSRNTLDSGYYSTATINSQASTIPESSLVESEVLVPDSDGMISFSLDVSSSPIPSVIDCSVVTDSSTVTSEGETLLEVDVLEEKEVTSRLVFKQPNEDGPDVRGGSVDALIVYATAPGQNGCQFPDAFLITYRTFISPCDLIKKLLQRYNKLRKTDDIKMKELGQDTFSFLTKVVDDLCRETNKEMLQILMDLVYQLLNDGELEMAREMRKRVLDKSGNYRVKQAASQSTTLLSSYRLTTEKHSIIDFKAVNIAEQMTLLDSVLFNKIEIPEILRWCLEQSEEQNPNLTKFTEHFNNMSYWCRTRILEQEEPKERERHLMKFMKVMKHLRRLNNFNSYLAILSAVDSAPVRRLEWQKQNVEALKEFSELIDSSSSFRTYRQALADATSPCIPYIGLVLQDLTFVNIGNLDYLPDRNINFSKCWQYFTIVQNMSRFRKCGYDFKKNEKIGAFFNNFDYFLSEESLWQLSEMIKPRGGKAPAKQTD